MNNLQGYRFDKISLNAASFQTADSTVSVCTSIEADMKQLKKNNDNEILKIYKNYKNGTTQKYAHFI